MVEQSKNIKNIEFPNNVKYELRDALDTVIRARNKKPKKGKKVAKKKWVADELEEFFIVFLIDWKKYRRSMIMDLYIVWDRKNIKKKSDHKIIYLGTYFLFNS